MEDTSQIDAPAEVAEQRPSRVEETIDSVTLARLLEEVRNADVGLQPTAYNRMHNRHNRS